MGLEFDAWQEGIGRLALAKRADGSYAATVGGIGMSLPRQVGKTLLMSGTLFALCTLRPGLLVIWTAQHTGTSDETFLGMQGFAKRHQVAPFVEKVYTGSGDEEVRFTNGSRILFGAREAGFGRGIPGVDILVFDEAQILSDRAMDAMLATMNTSKVGLAFYTGTPPRPEDRSDAFSAMRAEAIAGESSDSVWVECSADADADPDDRGQWRKANPSFPHRTPPESILRLRKRLVEESFKREALGIWDQIVTKGAVPMDSWAEVEDEHSTPGPDPVLGVEVGPDLGWASVVLAARREDGLWHVNLAKDRTTRTAEDEEREPGATWLEPYLRKLLDANPQIRGVVVDVGGPIAPLVEEHQPRQWRFKVSKIPVEPLKVQELGQATAHFMSSLIGGSLRIFPATSLTAAAKVAGKRPLGDTGMWVFSRRSAASDITPVQAMVLALWGAQKPRMRRPAPNPDRAPGRTAGGRRGGGRLAGRR